MAISQSNDLNSTTNYIMEEDNNSTENGPTAIQLLNEDYYSDGSIEKIMLTSVAFFQHGIIAQLFIDSAYHDIYNIQTVGTPVNNKSYYVYANESNYYKLYGAGQYASIMSVRTANKNEFELQIDILSILDGI